MRTLLLIFHKDLIIRSNGNNRTFDRKDVRFIISRYLGNVPKEFRKQVYNDLIEDMVRSKLLRKVDRYKVCLVNEEASARISELHPKIERDWF